MTEQEKSTFKRLQFDGEGFVSGDTLPTSNSSHPPNLSVTGDVFKSPSRLDVSLPPVSAIDRPTTSSRIIPPSIDDLPLTNNTSQPLIKDVSLGFDRITTSSQLIPTSSTAFPPQQDASSSSRSPGLHTPPIRTEDPPVQGVYAAEDNLFDGMFDYPCVFKEIAEVSYSYARFLVTL